jgi:hypothetical protein
MAIVELILLLLASWRLMVLIIFDTGPFDFMLRIRTKVGAEVAYDDATQLGKLFQCQYCMSIWTSIFLVSFWLVLPAIAWPVILMLALSAGAVLIEEVR